MIKIPIPVEAKGLIFDLDGTLIDSMPIHHAAYNYVLESYGIQYPKETFYSRGGIPTRDTLMMIAKENGIEGFNLEQALEDKRTYVERHMDQVKLIRPVFDVVEKYHGVLPMAIGTGSNRKVVEDVFERFGLDDYFTHSVSATEVHQYKPHPETFLKCASLLGIQPNDCVVFEDGKPGMQAAVAAGMMVIDVTEYF
ncbi:MAG: beta-phosphoglucomutase family hydrolase [Reichenbachiella sp.]|uniref:HAD family hydrolase n=1 Tax=Reichenbachiella sp. TaxID=2184521 RepID=UPI00326662CE